MPAFIPVPAGTRFGRWTVTRDRVRGEGHVDCRCDCGTERRVFLGSLRSDASVACGCYTAELLRVRSTTHGGSKTRTYRIWFNMLERCRNTRTHAFQYYGARGIRVCDRWETFAGFRADMGEAPEDRSLDRVDNDGPYAPDNCRWATKSEQAMNRRMPGHERMVLSPRETADIQSAVAQGGTAAGLAAKYGVSRQTIAYHARGRARAQKLPGSAAAGTQVENENKENTSWD